MENKNTFLIKNLVLLISICVVIILAGSNWILTKEKELFLIPGATHIQTYYVPEYVNRAVGKLNEFFGKYL